MSEENSKIINYVYLKHLITLRIEIMELEIQINDLQNEKEEFIKSNYKKYIDEHGCIDGPLFFLKEVSNIENEYNEEIDELWKQKSKKLNLIYKIKETIGHNN